MNARNFDHFLNYWDRLQTFNNETARPVVHQKANKAKASLRKLLRRSAAAR